MKLGLLIVLASICLAVSGCMVERGGGYYYTGDNDPHDYSRRVWHE